MKEITVSASPEARQLYASVLASFITVSLFQLIIMLKERDRKE